MPRGIYCYRPGFRRGSGGHPGSGGYRGGCGWGLGPGWGFCRWGWAGVGPHPRPAWAGAGPYLDYVGPALWPGLGKPEDERPFTGAGRGHKGGLAELEKRLQELENE